ncbi:MAG TPA: class I SAM-dependent methyltransferase [Thermoanaerobaculia bacterium]|nr:class I SAM-dependent methyltransferase [Thermoanaerobaculia bacterium]
MVEEALRSLDDLSERSRLRLFDPACGSGEFLREVLRQLRLQAFPGQIALIGYDISPAACAMARFVLSWERRGMEERVSVRVVCCDSLSDEEEWPTDVDVVLMNPPFQSWPEIQEPWKAAMRRILGDLAKGRPDLATAFLWKAVASLTTKAVLGSVLPASFLDGEALRSLRGALGETLTPCLIARLGSHSLFHEARVDAALYIAGRGIGEETPLAVWADHRPSSVSTALRRLRRLRSRRLPSLAPDDGDGFSLYPLPGLGQGEGSWAPRAYRDMIRAQRATALPRVSDRFDVRQGAHTGLNRVFLLSKEDWGQRLQEPERQYFRPCVLNESIREGRLFDEAYVFYPYGAVSIRDEEELEQVVPTFLRERLEPNKKALLDRKPSDPERWWDLLRPRDWQARPKIVSTYFGDAGSFAWDADGRFVVVQGYGWLPESKMGRKHWLAYLALLNSEIFSSLLAAHSNHVGGGQWNLSKRFVAQVPLPDLGTVEASLLSALAALGARIHSDGLAELTTDERSRLTELADVVYVSDVSDSIEPTHASQSPEA